VHSQRWRASESVRAFDGRISNTNALGSIAWNHEANSTYHREWICLRDLIFFCTVTSEHRRDLAKLAEKRDPKNGDGEIELRLLQSTRTFTFLRKCSAESIGKTGQCYAYSYVLACQSTMWLLQTLKFTYIRNEPILYV